MRPNIPQWWRIDSYVHLFVLKSLPNEQASWWLFPRQGLVLPWQHVYMYIYIYSHVYTIHRGQDSPSGTFTQGTWEVIGGVGGIKKGCEKADTAATLCLAGGGPRLQLHAWLRAFEGSSSGDPLVSYCWNHCREQSQQSCNLPADCLGKGCFLSAALWAWIIGSRLWIHSVGRGDLCPVRLLWAFWAGLWVSDVPNQLSCCLIAPF